MVVIKIVVGDDDVDNDVDDDNDDYVDDDDYIVVIVGSECVARARRDCSDSIN